MIALCLTAFLPSWLPACQLTCQVECRKLLVFGSRKAFPGEQVFHAIGRNIPGHVFPGTFRTFALNQLKRKARRRWKSDGK